MERFVVPVGVDPTAVVAGPTSVTISPPVGRSSSLGTSQLLREVESPLKEIVLVMFEASGLTGNEKVPFEELVVPDIQQSFLQDLGLDTRQVGSEFQDARNYFVTQFGIDPEDFTGSEGKRELNNHRFYPFIFKKTVGYHAHFPTEDGGGRRYPIQDGGYVLIVGEPGFIAHGKYGGNDGLYIKPRSIILYGWIRIDYPSGIRLYHYQSDLPFISCLQDVYKPQTMVFNTNKGESFGTESVGYGMGASSTFREGDGTYRVGGRNVITFPGYYDKF